MLNIISFNEDYNKNLKTYNKKDGLLALLLFLIIIIEYSIMGVLYNNISFIKENIRVVGSIANLLMIFITIFFVRIRKQKIDTIGFKGKWKLSIIIGGILSLFYLYNNCISHLLNGSTLIPLKNIIELVIYFSLVSICEEIVFRGYIGTRLNGLVKNKYFVLLLTGLLFIIMHFPYRMIAHGMGIIDLTINNISWILDLFIFHIILSFIYAKTNSIYGSIIPHWISDLAYSIISK